MKAGWGDELATEALSCTNGRYKGVDRSHGSAAASSHGGEDLLAFEALRKILGNSCMFIVKFLSHALQQYLRSLWREAWSMLIVETEASGASPRRQPCRVSVFFLLHAHESGLAH